MIRMNIKNNTATFTQNRTQVESVDLRLITSHQDIAQWAERRTTCCAGFAESRLVH